MRSLIVMTLVAAAATSASAQDGPRAVGSDEYFEAGAGAFARPRYPGSRHFNIGPRPTFGGIADIEPTDRLGGGVREGLRYNLSPNPERWGIGPAARIDFGRRRSDADRYTPGLGKVGIGVELGGFGQLAIGENLVARVEGRQAVSGHEGFIADAVVEGTWRYNDRTALVVGPRLRYTDGRYNRAYFGVTPAQSLASAGRFATFTPGAGISEVGGGATLYFPIAERWSGSVNADYGRLIGPVADSPVVLDRDGSRDQWSGGVTLTYRFRRGGSRSGER